MNDAAFARALLSPNMPVPAGLIDPSGRPAPRRFDVYRNNVTLGLIRVLEAGFPATRALVGDAFFAAMAGEFVRAHPPKMRMMMLYGDEFAPFIAGFAPAATLGYLPDVAHLEQAIRQSYHAQDAAAIDGAQLACMDDAALLASRLIFAPAVHLLQSLWPIASIWAANMRGGPSPQMQAQSVIVLRLGFDPDPVLLPDHAGPVIAALLAGARLGDALAVASGPFDLMATLKLLLGGGAITGVDSHAD
jgi:hypothetical protein